eukprot:TRINITY_DN19916_c0_g1_i1.p1 TRINITY_DN19916_c0_g1~~TRINITY_DN19916_c0_g1_i1.p1  ORF type:complete len:489 (-),score=55.91 TRINITY_DN19916_c0_g1_i1:108-1574(-)
MSECPLDDEFLEQHHTQSFREQEHVLRYISSGQRARRKIRIGICAVMLLCGSLSAWGFQVAQRGLVLHSAGHRCMTLPVGHLFWILREVLLFWRVVFLSLAPLAGDLNLTRCVILLDAAVLVTSWRSILPPPSNVHLRPFRFFGVVLHCILAALCALLLLPAIFFRDASRMQKYTWRVLSWWLGASTVWGIVWCAEVTMYCHEITADIWCLAIQASTFHFVRHPRFREKVHSGLKNMFDRRTASRAAVGIAGLVGETSMKNLLRISRARFRAVRVADIEYEDIVDNRPRPDLFSRTVAMKLNECDAFISHSWHDPAKEKWECLQKWRVAFVAEQGREPFVWLDKFCIDQNNIEESLCCLPIFLSGCRRLVIFCGTKYLRRLWCIMEIFTYVHIDGDLNQLEFHYVEEKPGADRLLIDAGFHSFSAEKCECFKPAEKVKMLSIIHTAFGTLKDFDRAVAEVFSKVGLRGLACRDESSDESTDGSELSSY